MTLPTDDDVSRNGGTPRPPGMTPASFAALRSMKELEPSLGTKWTNGWGDEDGSVTLDENGNIVALDLGGRRLRKLSGSNFEGLDKLSTLNLGGTDLPMECVKSIVSSVPGLRKLCLGGNGISTAAIVADLGEVLPNVPNLITLDLRYNDLGPDACATLANEVSRHEHLCFLHLEGNKIGDDGAAALGLALSSPTCSIKELYLGDNQINAAGAVKLAKAVGANQSLEKLYLEGNKIGPEGAEAFSTQLETLHAKGVPAILKKLYVDNNDIGKDRMKRLARALNSETVVEEMAA